MEAELLAFFVRVGIWVLATAVSYIILAAPLFRRGLIYSEVDVPWQAPVTEDLRLTRRYFFRRAAMFALAVAIGTGFFYPALTHVQWQNYGTPILVGALFGIGAGLARLNDRLRPWSDQR